MPADHSEAVTPRPSVSGTESHLRQALGPLMLWGLGVGYVISGEYFGWNLGLPAGGSLGMLVALVLVTVMYVTFVFSYTEMACAIPRAGGVFVYSTRALGPAAGYLGGVAQAVEFVFAPPAIALAIGGYIANWIPPETRDQWNALLPGDLSMAVALAAYLLFTALNIWGVKQAATFELFVTVIAVLGLLLFLAYTLPALRLENLLANAWPRGWTGALASIPFAIWFYLAIEGVANAAEEAIDPQRDVARGFGAAMITLVVLACLTFFGAVGVGGWERVVYDTDQLLELPDGVGVREGAVMSDSPLPLAMRQVVPVGHIAFHLIVGIGLLGLVASFNGIVLASGRALFEMGRVGFFVRALGRNHPRTQTPVTALLTNMLIGILSIALLDTGGLITMSAFGAVTLYIISMISLMKLRQVEPDLPRPYRTPFYPLFPLVALTLAVVSLGAMTWFGWDAAAWWRSSALWYFGYLAAAMVYYRLVLHGRISETDLAHFRRLDDTSGAAEAARGDR